MYKEVIVFIIGCMVLIKASQYAVKSITHLARYFRLTEFVTSFILVALVSALPDAFISITAALTGNPQLGVGSLLGGNIADLTIILGLVALAGHPLRISSHIVKKDLYFAGLAVLPIILGINGTLSRLDGAILLTSGIIFFIILLKEARYFHKPYKENNSILKNTIIFLISLGLLLVSSHYIVESASTMAISLGVPQIILGAILIGLGTTLPEFSFSLQSIKKGHADLAVGDLLGNVIVDSCILLGIVALINPVTLNIMLWTIMGTFVIFAVLFALVFMRTDGILTKNEALALVLFYIAFIVVQVLLR